jgi:hypothetical protein
MRYALKDDITISCARTGCLVILNYILESFIYINIRKMDSHKYGYYKMSKM